MRSKRSKMYQQTAPHTVRTASLLLASVCFAFTGCSAAPGTAAAEPAPSPAAARSRRKNPPCPVCVRCTRG